MDTEFPWGPPDYLPDLSEGECTDAQVTSTTDLESGPISQSLAQFHPGCGSKIREPVITSTQKERGWKMLFELSNLDYEEIMNSDSPATVPGIKSSSKSANRDIPAALGAPDPADPAAVVPHPDVQNISNPDDILGFYSTTTNDEDFGPTEARGSGESSTTSAAEEDGTRAKVTILAKDTPCPSPSADLDLGKEEMVVGETPPVSPTIFREATQMLSGNDDADDGTPPPPPNSPELFSQESAPNSPELFSQESVRETININRLNLEQEDEHGSASCSTITLSQPPAKKARMMGGPQPTPQPTPQPPPKGILVQKTVQGIIRPDADADSSEDQLGR